jgi:hypothetical protein
MQKTVIRLVILFMIILVSTGGIVLGATKNAADFANGTDNAIGTYEPNTTGTYPVETHTIGNAAVTPEPIDADTDNAETMETYIPEVTQSPRETSVQNIPVETPKSPGFGYVVSAIVLLSAVYITRRK